MSASRRSQLSVLLVAGAYFASAKIGGAFWLLHGTGSPNCPAAGIAVATAVLLGPIAILGVGLGAVLAAFTSHEPLASAALLTAAPVLQATTAGILLRRVAFQPAMRRISDVASFVLFGAIIAGGIGAVFGTLSVVAAGMVGHQPVADVLRDWWLVDFARILIPGSLVLVFAGRGRRALFSSETAQVVVAVIPVGAASVWLLYGRGALPYLVLPLLFALAATYRQRGATLGSAVIALVALVLTMHGHGPFVGGTETASLIRAETFVAVGSITALLVAAALSERQLAQSALGRLANSERALAEAQRVGGIGSFEVDLSTLKAAWSDELYRILGRDPEGLEPTWSMWRERIVPEDREHVDATTRRMYAECGSCRVVFRVTRIDGQVRWMDTRLSYEREHPDQPPVRVHGTCQDVTSLKLAEDRLRALFEHAPYPIVVVDETGVIAETNLPAQEMFGVPSDELVGQVIDRFVFQPSGETDPWYASVGQDGTHPDVDLWGRRTNGTDFPLEVFLTPLATEEGTLMSVGLRDVTKLRQVSEMLHFEARHDALTGLPNRLMFLEQLNMALSRARRSGRPLAVVFADLDDFKQVNDTRGHDIGDTLLRALTPRLHAAVRHGDLVARLGGDEFVVLCEDLADEAAAAQVAQRLADMVAEPVLVAGREHRVSLSAGVVMVTDPAAIGADGVLRDADAAMYSAKAEGKGRIAVFDPTSSISVWDGAAQA